MSIVLIIVRVLLLFAVLNFAVKLTGSFLDNSESGGVAKRPGYVWQGRRAVTMRMARHHAEPAALSARP